jgi:hypothetical protein
MTISDLRPIEVTNTSDRPIFLKGRRIPNHPGGKKVVEFAPELKVLPGEKVVYWLQYGTFVAIR